jgi:hypothetical protein
MFNSPGWDHPYQKFCERYPIAHFANEVYRIYSKDTLLLVGPEWPTLKEAEAARQRLYDQEQV